MQHPPRQLVRPRREVPLPWAPVSSSFEGELILVTAEGAVSVYDTRGQCLQQAKLPNDAVGRPALAREGCLLVPTRERGLWNVTEARSEGFRALAVRQAAHDPELWWSLRFAAGYDRVMCELRRRPDWRVEAELEMSTFAEYLIPSFHPGTQPREVWLLDSGNREMFTLTATESGLSQCSWTRAETLLDRLEVPTLPLWLRGTEDYVLTHGPLLERHRLNTVELQNTLSLKDYEDDWLDWETCDIDDADWMLSSAEFASGQSVMLSSTRLLCLLSTGRLLMVDLETFRAIGEAALVGFEPYRADVVQGPITTLAGNEEWVAFTTRDNQLLISRHEDWLA